LTVLSVFDGPEVQVHQNVAQTGPELDFNNFMLDYPGGEECRVVLEAKY
jgi:hypothetical protein